MPIVVRFAPSPTGLLHVWNVRAAHRRCRAAPAARWQQVVAGPVAPVIEDASFLAEAGDKLPAEP